MKKKISIFLTIVFLSSCSGFSEAGKALRNEKTRTTDEFLIEKRKPLSIPPNMNELPKPKSQKAVKEKSKTNIGTAINESDSKEKSKLEKILLEEIRNN